MYVRPTEVLFEHRCHFTCINRLCAKALGNVRRFHCLDTAFLQVGHRAVASWSHCASLIGAKLVRGGHLCPEKIFVPDSNGIEA